VRKVESYRTGKKFEPGKQFEPVFPSPPLRHFLSESLRSFSSRLDMLFFVISPTFATVASEVREIKDKTCFSPDQI
jgi:hypothetical protein